MQQFIVPQFIDVEDKIIGPITTRQFIIMLAGAIIIAISYKLFDFSLFVTFGLLVLCVCGVLSFLKVNGRPFHYFILNLFQTIKRPKLRIWYHNLVAVAEDYGLTEGHLSAALPPLTPEKHYTASRLAELSLIVDTKGAYKGESGEEGKINIQR